jgi:hypothetical protein
MVSPSGAATLVMSGLYRDIAVAPDGSRIVYAGSNGSQLFVRTIGQIEPTALAELGSPLHPFVSPDGEWIGFLDGQTARRGGQRSNADVALPAPGVHASPSRSPTPPRSRW